MWLLYFHLSFKSLFLYKYTLLEFAVNILKVVTSDAFGPAVSRSITSTTSNLPTTAPAKPIREITDPTLRQNIDVATTQLSTEAYDQSEI